MHGSTSIPLCYSAILMFSSFELFGLGYAAPCPVSIGNSGLSYSRLSAFDSAHSISKGDYMLPAPNTVPVTTLDSHPPLVNSSPEPINSKANELNSWRTSILKRLAEAYRSIANGVVRGGDWMSDILKKIRGFFSHGITPVPALGGEHMENLKDEIVLSNQPIRGSEESMKSVVSLPQLPTPPEGVHSESGTSTPRSELFDTTPVGTPQTPSLFEVPIRTIEGGRSISMPNIILYLESAAAENHNPNTKPATTLFEAMMEDDTTRGIPGTWPSNLELGWRSDEMLGPVTTNTAGKGLNLLPKLEKWFGGSDD